MKQVDKCEVCGGVVSVSRDTLHSEGLVCEEFYDCSHCGYSYAFAYGTTRRSFGGVDAVYFYNTPEADIKVRDALVDEKIAAWKKWQKYGWIAWIAWGLLVLGLSIALSCRLIAKLKGAL